MEDNRAEQEQILKKPSVNKQVKAFGMNRLRKMGYKEADCRAILAKSFRELKEAWINHYGKIQ